jgi:ribokinase
MKRTALFVGDTTLDSIIVAPHMPEPDEKVFIDLYSESLGGVAANSAAACRLAGADVMLCSVVADDAGGRIVREQLDRIGLTARLGDETEVTTRAIVMLDEAGEKRLFLFPGDRMYPTVSTVLAIPLEHVGWMHTAIYDRPAAAELIRRCRDASIPWSIDLEPATIPEDFDDLTPHLIGCETVIANARAISMLGTDPVQRLLELGVRVVVETLGSAGARLHERGGDVFEVPSGPVARVRDTTGAGDALAGWYVAERLRGLGAVEALTSGVRAAGFSVSTIGTVASYPTRSQLLVNSAERQEQ